MLAISGQPEQEEEAVRVKYHSLEEWFSRWDSALVAFSGGVDSSVLAYSARKVLKDRALAVTSLSQTFAASELHSARVISREIGIELVEVIQDDLASKDYVSNPVNRCYFCRSNLVQAIVPIVRERKISVCVDGTHVDDMSSPRPGVKALREAGFKAPFVELGFHKEDIRQIARFLSLSNAERPSEACLSSRIAYGQRIDLETLRRIEQAESLVRDLLNAEIVRVRTIGKKAVIELDLASVPKAQRSFRELEVELTALGYASVEIDPNGYRSGRMLELFVRDNE